MPSAWNDGFNHLLIEFQHGTEKHYPFVENIHYWIHIENPMYTPTNWSRYAITTNKKPRQDNRREWYCIWRGRRPNFLIPGLWRRLQIQPSPSHLAPEKWQRSTLRGWESSHVDLQVDWEWYYYYKYSGDHEYIYIAWTRVTLGIWFFVIIKWTASIVR